VRRVRRVLVGFDADGDGDTAADALAGELLAVGVEVYRLHLPHGSDINDLARSSKSATDALGRSGGVTAAIDRNPGRPTHNRST
jgi:phosphomannomutase